MHSYRAGLSALLSFLCYSVSSRSQGIEPREITWKQTIHEMFFHALQPTNQKPKVALICRVYAHQASLLFVVDCWQKTGRGNNNLKRCYEK